MKLAVPIAAAFAAFVVGVHWGTFAAGGSDSSCYLSQARLFTHFTTHIDQPLIAAAPWSNAAWTFTPAGHIPSPVGPEFIVPICPPGLPLLMAAAHIVPFGEMLVVPLSGALAVWLTFVLGRRLDGDATGAAAAVLVACSPIFLYQVVQPMTDVPVTAWWLLAAVLAVGPGATWRRMLAAGLAAALAVLTRPNLLPLALIIGAAVFASPRRYVGLLWFAAGLVPGLVLLGILQSRMYGSPWASGYGAPQDLFQTGRVIENVRRYSGWLIETHTPAILIGLAAPLVTRRPVAWLCLAMAAAVFLAYLPYRVFDDWWYLRFLLPALPFLIVLGVTVVVWIVERGAKALSWFGLRLPVLGAAIALVAALWIHTARERSAFNLAAMEHHFVEAGTFAAERLPDRAAVLTVLHSGAVHYYSGRPTLSWDTLPPGGLDQSLAFLRAHGLRPVLMFDATEEPAFRARFEHASAIGRLDWPPMARIGRTVRVYDPQDREPYFATF